MRSQHVIDFELSESSVQGVGGVIGEITHCGEVLTTSKRWRCTAADQAGGAQWNGAGNTNAGIGQAGSIPMAWKTVAFDDSQWEIPGDLGSENVSWVYHHAAAQLHRHRTHKRTQTAYRRRHAAAWQGMNRQQGHRDNHSHVFFFVSLLFARLYGVKVCYPSVS